MPKGFPRDPRIKDHTPWQLRWFARQFRAIAEQHRKQAHELDEKAGRYDARAAKLEKAE